MKILEKLYDPGMDHYDGLRLLIDLITESFQSGDVKPVDDLLRVCDFNKMQTVFSLGLLRYTFSKQTYLPNWKQARDRVVESYKQRGLDWQHELRGLFGEYGPPMYPNLMDELTNVHPSLRT